MVTCHCICNLGDNEVTLEFHQHDDAEVSLMEMRFYIPTSVDSSDPDPVKVCHYDYYNPEYNSYQTL